MSQGFVLWFTGLSGSGKSTLTAMAAAELRRRGVHVETLDGDMVRKHLSKGLGFSREDRDVNIRRIGFVAKLVARSGGCAIAAAISPYREVRDELRRDIDRFCEVYTECPLKVLTERDPKGLYEKALAGEIKNFTGVDDPYEAPDDPEVHLHTDSESPEQSLAKIIARLEELGFIPRSGESSHALAGSSGSGLVLPHGNDLVDRMVRGDRASTAKERAKRLHTVTLGPREALDLAAVATGAYSPLTGFMGSKDYKRVRAAMRLESGFAWGVPVTLSAPVEMEPKLKDADEIALATPDGRLVALLGITDVWRPDKEAEMKQVLGTTDRNDPAVRALLSRGDVYVGGEVRCFELPQIPGLDAMSRPVEVREALTERDYAQVTSLSTDGLPARGDEYLARTALELADAVLLQPTGRPSDRLPLDVRNVAYERLASHYFPPHRAFVAPAPAPAAASAVRRAVTSALIAKNYGASSVIVTGHAGLDSELEHLFQPGEIGATIHLASEPRHSETLGTIATAHTAPDSGRPIDEPSIIAALESGQSVSDADMRPDIAELIRTYLARGAA